jgi:hypothetical protein
MGLLLFLLYSLVDGIPLTVVVVPRFPRYNATKMGIPMDDPEIEVLLMGPHGQYPVQTKHGIPLLDSVMDTARVLSTRPVTMYINGDVCLPPHWQQTLFRYLACVVLVRPFLITGPRLELPARPDPDWLRYHLYRLPIDMEAMDWFVYRTDDWSGIMPPFLLGRKAWDA